MFSRYHSGMDVQTDNNVHLLPLLRTKEYYTTFTLVSDDISEHFKVRNEVLISI